MTGKDQGKERIQTIDREGSGKGEDTNHWQGRIRERKGYKPLAGKDTNNWQDKNHWQRRRGYKDTNH